jgi:hypothetical protein
MLYAVGTVGVDDMQRDGVWWCGKVRGVKRGCLARCSSEPCQAGGGRMSPASLIGCCELVVGTRSE